MTSPIVVFDRCLDQESQVDDLMDVLDPDVFLTAVDNHCQQGTVWVGGREFDFQ